MRKLFLSSFLLFFVLQSCSRYQVNTISSTNLTKDEQTGRFNIENDSIKISYSFYGINAPVDIEIFNKLDRPLYIDWERSAMVIGESAVSYSGRDIKISGFLSSSTSTYSFSQNYGAQQGATSSAVSSTSGNLNAVATLPQKVTFLPPHSKIMNVPLSGTSGYLKLPDSLLRKDKANTIVEDGVGLRQVEVKTANFTKAKSPLVFRSYLTLYTLDGDNKVLPKVYEHEFYVSNMVSTLNTPNSLEAFKTKRGDYFITSKKTGYGKFMKGVGVAAIVGTAAVATALPTPEN